MKKELEDKAFLILDKMLDAVNSGVDKAPEFVAGLAEEYVAYFMISSITPLAISIMFLIVAVFFMSKGLSRGIESDWSGPKGDLATTYVCTSAFVILVTGMIIYYNTPDVLQAIYAPKAFLIENVRK